MERGVLAACCLVGVAAALGCRGREEDRPGEPIVATVGTATITAAQYKARLDEQAPFIRARYTTLERKQEFLNGLIQFEVLAQEAQRRGLDKDPEVQEALRKLIVQRMIRQVTEELKPPSETEVRQYYDEHRSEFVRPEQVRLNHVFLASAQGDARRAQVKAEALALVARARAQQAELRQRGFEELARERSDDATSKQMGGDLGPRTAEELTQAWGAALAQAAFALQAPNELGPLVETEKGFHLVMLRLRQAGLHHSLESVKERIGSRLLAERRTQALEALVKQLRERVPIHIEESVLDGVQPAAATAP
ncbi:peptidyl-prolyl cis-trans isomerase [Stigmatella sp. ncwal1]|uniref:Peptidyl-prolyl cis-trans isomerase n=1 Tax=Stigmatella ashevillensis TaxID=2995309 RepID=A0ABT5DIU0_9BACT|nr:peptidyl-prolyl cis-trans isomerase [Stigmatella ashevillena]MDC0712261.1 peptidyl-prolyl cis-trans isomerase [Stigmatella ashevillena]